MESDHRVELNLPQGAAKDCSNLPTAPQEVVAKQAPVLPGCALSSIVLLPLAAERLNIYIFFS